MSPPDITIKTRRLAISTFRPEHLRQEYVDWLNDKQLMQYSEQRHHQHSLESCRAYLESFSGSDNFFFAIEDHAGNMLGTMTVYQDTHNRLADIGILIGPTEAHGKGLGLEAWQTVSDWIINTLSPRKITGGCMASNKAMIKIMEKSGMRPDGVRKNHYLRNGQDEDIIYMARFIS